MYRIIVKTNFAAAHRLRDYPGNCERLHGHNWTVKAEIGARELDSLGIAYDFRSLKKNLQDIIDPFDHRLLNDVPPFDQLNPTSENLAKYIFHSLQQVLPPKIRVLAVEVGESEKCSVVYTED